MTRQREQQLPSRETISTHPLCGGKLRDYERHRLYCHLWPVGLNADGLKVGHIALLCTQRQSLSVPRGMIEQGCRLLSRSGYFGMIVPNKFFYTKAAATLRRMISEDRWLRTVVDFGDEHLFQGATNYSCILLLRKYPGRGPTYVKAKAGLTIIDEFKLPWSSLPASPWHFSKQSIDQLFSKLERLGTPLEKITRRFGTGVQSGADRLLALDLATVKEDGLETALLRPLAARTAQS